MKNANSVYHRNRYNSERACGYCEGVTDHERWCATRDPKVFYAYEILLDPSKISQGDALILHSLGVAWAETLLATK